MPRGTGSGFVVTPPNPIRPIQEALERVLRESGLHDFGRSMSSIDDLTAEVQQVYERVDDIERVLETIVPILERLTVVFEDIQEDLEPMSELASKIPGSGSRRRRREKQAADLRGAAALEPGAGPGPAGRAAPPAPQGPPVSGTFPAPVPARPPVDLAEDPDAGARFGPAGAGARPEPPGIGAEPSPGGTSALANVRPGATGYSPLGSRDREDR